MAALRRLTDWRTRLPSKRAPTAYARGGLPSTEISATPCRDGLAVGLPFGAITPCRRKRDACAGANVTAAAGEGAAPNNRVKSPRTAPAPTAATEWAGAVGARTSSFSDQYTIPPATRAQTTNAASRVTML